MSAGESRLLRKSSGPLVVGIIGRAKHGKTTVAEIVQNNFAYNDVAVFSFADRLKIEVFDWFQGMGFLANSVFGFGFNGFYGFPIPPRSRLFSEKQKIEWVNKYKAVLRPVLQQWGTEFRRAQDNDYWVDQTDADITRVDPQVALLPDTRFLNEVALCNVIVRVVREGYVDDPGVLAHESEQALKDVVPDYTISVPEGNMAQLQSEAVMVFREIFEKFGVSAEIV